MNDSNGLGQMMHASTFLPRKEATKSSIDIRQLCWDVVQD
jgi:hypothetical protein